jgi:hypothetical protein
MEFVTNHALYIPPLRDTGISVPTNTYHLLWKEGTSLSVSHLDSYIVRKLQRSVFAIFPVTRLCETIIYV